MRIRHFILICIILFNTLNPILRGQDYSWWNEKHNWDGVTHWSRYIIISPSYLGPNALPVPRVNTGTITNDPSWEFGADGHYNPGDKTINLATLFTIPLAQNRVALDIDWIPGEYYRMDTLTRDIRRARDYDGKGFSTGNLVIGTYIQLLKDRDRLPDMMLGINLKTATGSNLGAARHTDSPGYYFDLSFGKKFPAERSRIDHIHLYSMVGLYVYQTHYNKNYQNDAFLFGAGINLEFQKIIVEYNLGGYIGYIGDGDKPVVYRLALKTNRDKTWNFKFHYQQGIHDFDYSTFRLSALVNFSTRKEVKPGS
jgi:hypothetical protein